MPDRAPAGPTPADGRDPSGRTSAGGTTTGVLTGGSRPRSTGRRSWAIPLATFVVGVLLGAIGAGLSRDVDDVATPPAAVPPTASEPAAAPTSPPPGTDATITVPGACLQVADTGERLAGLVRDAADAAGQLDAAGLSDIVRQMGEVQPGLVAQSRECRSAGSPPATTAP